MIWKETVMIHMKVLTILIAKAIWYFWWTKKALKEAQNLKISQHAFSSPHIQGGSNMTETDCV
jgi:hypothetical protein